MSVGETYIESPRSAALLDQAFTRAAGALLLPGNRVRLLKDAGENYPAWLAAIRAAQHRVYFENYIFREDEIGREFALALAARAQAGVRVRVIYDWLGGFGRTSAGFWRSLRAAGVDVRCFNAPRLMSPFEGLHRDHRKMIAVDGRVGFVTGLCVARMWAGDPSRGIDPWRDTGIEVSGPAVAEIEQAFARMWSTIGEPVAADELSGSESCVPAGDVSVRIVASAPGTSGLFRLDQLIAASARRTLWLTDAYFAGVAPYVQALRAAARDGVDVRLLVPGASDIPLLRPLSQSGFRPLLEAGVRVFEWNGSMLHAKTAVADGEWARVGSSNLNVASWLGNYELDAVIENDEFAAAMEAMYMNDLANSTEIVLHARRQRRLRTAGGLTPGPLPGGRGDESLSLVRDQRSPDRLQSLSPPQLLSAPQVARSAGEGAGRPAMRGMKHSGGSASRAAAGAMRIGRTVGAALTGQRVLAPTEARTVAVVGLFLLIMAIVAVLWPWAFVVPFALVCTWIALALLLRARALRREQRALAVSPQPERTLDKAHGSKE